MILAVIGSRDFGDYGLLKEKLNNIENIELIVSGGADGADKLAEKYANEYKIPKEIIYPNWRKYVKKAGFLRNNTIVEKSDKVIAFWDRVSKGTEHSIKLAKKYNKLLDIINFE
jgi:hypothetical protein